jgi:superfamily II DNA or RNA helicase
MPAEDRYAIISAFERHKISVLVNQRLLATGYDCPAVTDVLLLTRIGSPILFEQIVGRAARGPRTGGSRVGTIWEFDDHLAMHGLPSSYYRYKDYDWS